MISIEHAIPRDDVILGAVRAAGVDMSRYPPDFDERLSRLIERRRRPLSAEEETRRTAARDILRNGSYKPTGRGKPASEYLIRAAERPDYTFPRINGPVDICNYMSLLHVLPISLWDLDRSRSDHFTFRLGQEGERFVFNEGGQQIDVKDLVVGCRVGEEAIPTEDPIVNPVKDSLATKTTPKTRRVAACVYAPSSAVSTAYLDDMCGDFADLLAQCGEQVETGYAVLKPGESTNI